MSNISYVKASFSCLPWIGFSFAAQSIRELETKYPGLTDPDPTKRLLTQTNQTHQASLEGRIYSICGIVGSIATLAANATLIAMGILSACSMWFLLLQAIPTASFLVFTHTLKEYNKNLSIQPQST